MLLFSKNVLMFTLAFYLLVNTHGFSKPLSIKTKKDQILVNDEVFFTKGIGYSPHRPKESPREKKIDMEQHRHDFKAIRKAGFNTLRTWSPLTLEELELAKTYDLMVIQGMWIDYRKNFSDPETIANIAEQLDQVVLESKEAGNVILYLVGNEPLPSQVFSIGREKTDLFFKNLKETIHKKSKTSLVSMSNWVQCDFLNDQMWDVNAFNLYPYNPESISFAMGYRGYVNWLKRERAKNRPLIITEMGLSVSPAGPGQFGYGGNSETEQKNGLLYMLNESMAGDVDGYCAFEWIDEWWKNFNHPSDSEIHEPHDAEEWFGIVHYDEQHQFHTREAYHAIKQWNQAILLEPKDLSKIINKSTDIKVYTESHIEEVAVTIGDNLESVLVLKRKSPHWYENNASLKHLKPGEHKVHMTAKGRLSLQRIANHLPEIEADEISSWQGVLDLIKGDSLLGKYMQDILGNEKTESIKNIESLEFFTEDLKAECLHIFNATLKNSGFITTFGNDISNHPSPLIKKSLNALVKAESIVASNDSLTVLKNANPQHMAEFILQLFEEWHPEIFIQTYEKEIRFHYDPKNNQKTPYTIEIKPQQDTYHTKNKMTPVSLQFIVTDQMGKPVPHEKITVSIYEPVLNQKLMLNLETDDSGIATQIYEVNEPGVLTVAAGVPLKGSVAIARDDTNSTVPIDLSSKYGDCKHIYIYY